MNLFALLEEFMSSQILFYIKSIRGDNNNITIIQTTSIINVNHPTCKILSYERCLLTLK